MDNKDISEEGKYIYGSFYMYITASNLYSVLEYIYRRLRVRKQLPSKF